MPGVKSSAVPFWVKAESKGLRMNPSMVAAAAFSPGVLQNMSTHKPKRKLHIKSSFRVVWRGNFIMKMIYMYAVAYPNRCIRLKIRTCTSTSSTKLRNLVNVVRVISYMLSSSCFCSSLPSLPTTNTLLTAEKSTKSSTLAR